jgi:hypothetical protein
MNQSPKYLIKLLEENGFLLKRENGSHQIYYCENKFKGLTPLAIEFCPFRAMSYSEIMFL